MATATAAGDGAGAKHVQTFELQHPGQCTGMFWREHPKRELRGAQRGNASWPRNGSLLRGVVHKAIDGDDWLEVGEWRQAGAEDWQRDCAGIWMPFHQGGLLLHVRED